MHFGSTLRLLRTDAGLSTRELARRIGVSSAYISRVENGHDPAPTADRLIAVAKVLGLPRVALLELAQQAGPAIDGYLHRVPAAAALFLEVAERDLSAAQIARIRAFVDQEFPLGARHRPLRLAPLIPPERVVLGFSGASIEDIVAVAATRLPRSVDARALARQILEREREAPSFLGGGFVVPHAVVSEAPELAVLVILARPLPAPGPDGKAVRVGVVAISPTAGPEHLELLARVARLARDGVADELCAATSAAAARSVVERLESLW